MWRPLCSVFIIDFLCGRNNISHNTILADLDFSHLPSSLNQSQGSLLSFFNVVNANVDYGYYFYSNIIHVHDKPNSFRPQSKVFLLSQIIIGLIAYRKYIMPSLTLVLPDHKGAVILGVGQSCHIPGSFIHILSWLSNICSSFKKTDQLHESQECRNES